MLAEAEGFTVAVYDPSFFIAFEPEKTDPVKLAEGAPQGCKAGFIVPKSDADSEELKAKLLNDAFAKELGQTMDVGSRLLEDHHRELCQVMRTHLLLLIAALTVLTASAAMTPSLAQQKAQPFAMPTAPGGAQAATPGAEVSAPGPIDRAWNWLMSEQSRMHREMAAAVKDLKTGDPMRATGLLMLIAFLYGVLHAAGPGHGKAVISSYVLSNEETVRRGIALSFLAALFQALSAIFFVGIFAMLFNRTSLEMRATETLLETLSWGLVALVGAWMLYRQFRATWPGAPLQAHGPRARSVMFMGPTVAAGTATCPRPRTCKARGRGARPCHWRFPSAFAPVPAPCCC